MKGKISLYDMVKLSIIVIVFVLLYRLVAHQNIIENSNILEGYTGNYMPNHFGNLVPIVNVKTNQGELNTTIITLRDTVKLESLNIDIVPSRSGMDNVRLFNGSVTESDEVSGNYLSDRTGEQDLPLVAGTGNNKNITIDDVYGANKTKINTNIISVMVEGGEQFEVGNIRVYGTHTSVPNRTQFPNNLNVLDSSSFTKLISVDTENPNNKIYRYSFVNPIKCHMICFTPQISGHSNKHLPPVEVHYESVRNNNFKVTGNFYIDSGKNHLFLPNSIVAQKIYLKVPTNYKSGASSANISGLSDESFVGLYHTSGGQNNSSGKSNFSNVFTDGSGQAKEDFSALGGYSADDMCPNLQAIEDKLRLTDQICSRLEYNDKIKNERIKLERNKQYILKLKQQDEEIQKLEKIIKSLQNKREDRDAYNDALRLAQYNKQNRHAAIIKDLAQKRDELRKNNVVNVQLNLRNNPRANSSS